MGNGRRIDRVSSLAGLLLAIALAAPALAQEGATAAARQGAAAGAAHTLALRSWSIDTRRGEPRIPARLRLWRQPGADEVLLVKFPAPPTAEQLAALDAATLRVYTYLPHHAFLVKVPPGGGRKLAALGVSWQGPYHPAYKLSPEIAAADGRSPDTTLRPVMLHLLPDADLDELVPRLREAGAERIVGAAPRATFSRVRLLLAEAEIAALREELARQPEVFWIELEGRRTLRNDTTVWVGQSGLGADQFTSVFKRGIYGEGQVIAVLDTGLDTDMCWFRDPARGLPPSNPCNGGTAVDGDQRKVIAVDFLDSGECAGGLASVEWDTQDHGTHVAGTAAGDNFATPLAHDTADGMAPGARLVIQDAGFATDNCGDLPGIGCPVVDLVPLFHQTYAQGARIHTNSWGDNENDPTQHDYSAGSQDVDEFMWAHPDFLILFAAGNSGPGNASVGSPSTAKSGLSVGATLRGTSAGSMASFSSCGPTLDGRRKPEITVPGSSIVSANADNNVGTNNCNTKSSSGTSMATPGAAGLAALVRQYYQEGWQHDGVSVPVLGFAPSAALVRATLVNGAVPMSGVAGFPTNCQGWGRVLLDDALYFRGDTRRLQVEDHAADAFPNGASGVDRTYLFTVAAGQPLKVTLAWTDFPSTPAAATNLVNDLDLRLEGPTGLLWLGNVFASGSSTTGGSADRLNTLEQVLLPSPAAGLYRVTVRAHTVPFGPQPFALVVTGAVERPRAR